jgi:hypothetical protein
MRVRQEREVWGRKGRGLLTGGRERGWGFRMTLKLFTPAHSGMAQNMQRYRLAEREKERMKEGRENEIVKKKRDG